MCAAIDTTLGAISSGIVHSGVGACDPRGLFVNVFSTTIRTTLMALLR
jgi:hypothetical protein